NAKDVVTAGVVRPELPALGRVEATFEERAENGRLHFGPIECGGAVQDADFLSGERQRGSAVEQATIEVRHVLEQHLPTSTHCLKELSQVRLHALGVLGAL